MEPSVTETAHSALLSRDEAAVAVREVFGPQLSVLEEMVNYGTNLIPRAFVSSEKKTQDIVIIHNFLKQAVALMDGIHIAMTQGSRLSATILFRSLFEVRIYLEWILQQDTTDRALAYYVWHIRNRRFLYRRSKPGTKEFEIFQTQLEHDTIDISEPLFPAELLDAEIAKCDRILAQPMLTGINARFDAATKPGKKDRDWYSASGISDLRAMSKAIGKEAEYSIYYGYVSKVTHGLAFDRHVTIEATEAKGVKTLRSAALRGLLGLDELFQFVFMFSQIVFELILKHYRRDEFDGGALARKYLNEWRDRRLSIPKVEEIEGEIRVTPTPVPPIGQL